MALTEEELIKIILGAVVIVVVLIGLYFFMRYHVIDFFKNLGSGKNIQTAKLILDLI